MDLWKRWLGNREWLTLALWERHWSRVKQTSLDSWRRSKSVREWPSKNLNLAVAPPILVAIVVLSKNQAGVAATLVGAWFVLAHNISQAAADFRRRINETYGKAVTQLASDKLEERLGGIYTLENISKESPDDHLTVMETLTAFVRERSQRNERARTAEPLEKRIEVRAYHLWEQAGKPFGADFSQQAIEGEELGELPAVDIQAVLSVITRRSPENCNREISRKWRIDLRKAVLRRADLRDTHLERADLREAHLEGADFADAHLEEADLSNARLEAADLSKAHLEKANLSNAHLERAKLRGTHFEEATLKEAHLERANLVEAHLEAAKLWGAHLEEADLSDARLEEAGLNNAHLEGAYLLGAHLERTYVGSGIHLEGAKLYGAHFENSDLTSVCLEGANLQGTHFEGAILKSARLEEADFAGANLEGAELVGAQLERADLSEALGLSGSQIAAASGDAATKLPDGLAHPAHWLASGTA